MSQIKLKSDDGKVFDVDIKAARLSATINTMLQDLGHDEGDKEAIPLTKVNSTVLKKVIEWANHHKDDSPVDTEAGDRSTADIPQWDQDFLKVDQTMLLELIQAANYLDMKGLMDVTAQTVANMIKGKTAEQVREMFAVKNDFTPEEEDAIRQENKWAEEQQS